VPDKLIVGMPTWMDLKHKQTFRERDEEEIKRGGAISKR